MRAVFLTGHGGNEVVAVGQRPLPPVGPGEVRVRLHAATLNRVDLYMRDSGAGITHQIPQIMGLDGAGVIDAMAPDETQLQAGQRVRFCAVDAAQAREALRQRERAWNAWAYAIAFELPGAAINRDLTAGWPLECGG